MVLLLLMAMVCYDKKYVLLNIKRTKCKHFQYPVVIFSFQFSHFYICFRMDPVKQNKNFKNIMQSTNKYDD
jgi:hypothetical protein